MYYVHKYQVAQQYGGPEEGGWWYESGNPVSPLTNEPTLGTDKRYVFVTKNEDDAYEVCRVLNRAEMDRRENEEAYDYTSTLAYHSNHYSYQVSQEPVAKPYPAERPHYE